MTPNRGGPDFVRVRTLQFEAFLKESEELPVLDVRTPAEFQHGHIPGAVNLPLFTDEERAIIGTLYKQTGREEAIREGLGMVGPRLKEMVERTDEIVRNRRGAESLRNVARVGAEEERRRVLVHCWRGGMRSGSVAWLLHTAGYDAATLEGGYKSFRRFVLSSLELERPLLVLGGRTGSAKTEILGELRKLGEQVIDLEGLANHRGSAFGHLGLGNQPTEEQFQNDLALQWRSMDPGRRVWIEDESRQVGRITIPLTLWQGMREAPVLFLEISRERRVRFLSKEYGSYPLSDLRELTEKIQKRLGGLQTREALEDLEAGEVARACEKILSYYDRAYEHGVSKREEGRVFRFEPGEGEPPALAEEILARAESLGL